MNASYQLHSSHRQAGFSLIEILVGLVIGLLVTLVITQVFSVFEGQKRSTTGSADAQTNGGIALYSIAHELRMAGYGLLPATDSPLNCTTPISFGATGIITDISPVTITDGGPAAGASDSITIRYATSNLGGAPSPISANPVGLSVPLNTNMACHKDDVAMIINGTTCNLAHVTGPTDIAIPPVPSTPPDLDIIHVELDDVTGAVPGAKVACLGSWVTTVFQVNPNYDPTDPANSQAYLERDGDPSISDIVNIQAQYGISSTPSSNQIIDWVDAKDGLPSGDWGPSMTGPNRNRIKAVRVAVVARNGSKEKDKVTFSCSSTTLASPTGLCAWDATSAAPAGSAPGTNFPAPVIDLSNDTDPVTLDPTWQYYRYRVFETIIPLRNMIWSSSTL
jgi:type IV pilus assembly protein PilW